MLGEGIRGLHAAGVGAFRYLREEPAFSEIRLAPLPIESHGITRDGRIFKGDGRQSYFDLALEQPVFVCGIRIAYSVTADTQTSLKGVETEKQAAKPGDERDGGGARPRAAEHAQDQEDRDAGGSTGDVVELYGTAFKQMAFAIWWRDAGQQKYSEVDRYVDVKSPEGNQAQTVTIWVYKKIDQLRVHPVRIRQEGSHFVLSVRDIVCRNFCCGTAVASPVRKGVVEGS
jgi:hypothetical protein